MSLDKAVLLLKDIIEIPNSNFNDIAYSCEFQDRVDSLKASQIDAAFVNDNALQNTISCKWFSLKNAVL